MIDTRAFGQELQDQLQAAARKGQQRVTTTARTVIATARMIRPQLPSLPRPTPETLRSALPTPAQIRSALPTPEQIRSALPTPEQIRSALPTPEQIRSALSAPAQLIERAPAFAAKLPGGDKLTASTNELVGQVRAAQQRIIDQVREVTAPLAKRAGFAEYRAVPQDAARHGTPHHAGTENGSAAEPAAEKPATEHARAQHAKPSAKPAAKGGTKPKPKPKPTAR
jgi:hypothetical protein